MTIANFNEYRDVTSSGFKEIVALTDRTKAEAKAIAQREIQMLEDKVFVIVQEQTSRINQISTKALEQLAK